MFDDYKENFAGSLAESYELKIDDVFVMATPLAAEQIQSPQMWSNFAKIAVEREYEVESRDYFKNYANLAWAMSKVGFSGGEFWTFIERLFSTELERTKLKEQPRELTSSVLATICFALKDCQTHDFTDEFWQKLNGILRSYLRERIQIASQGDQAAHVDDTETVNMMKMAIEANKRLDDSLLSML